MTCVRETVSGPAGEPLLRARLARRAQSLREAIRDARTAAMAGPRRDEIDEKWVAPQHAGRPGPPACRGGPRPDHAGRSSSVLRRSRLLRKYRGADLLRTRKNGCISQSPTVVAIPRPPFAIDLLNQQSCPRPARVVESLGARRGSERPWDRTATLRSTWEIASDGRT